MATHHQNNITYSYYILGERPVKFTSENGAPYRAEILDLDKKEFIRDLRLVPIIENSMDAKRIDENEFRNICLSKGVKPI